MDRVTPNGGHYIGKFHRGMLTTRLANNGINEPHPTLFGCGGAMAVRRQDFLTLGGFDELYYPAYWEDVDLCYKAWKRGQKSIYQPLSVMYHVHSASWKSDPVKRSQLSAISFRNCWLLTWRNVTSPKMLRSNVYWTTRHYFSSLRLRNQSVYQTYHKAFRSWHQAVLACRHDETSRIWSDSKILRFCQ